MLRGNVAGSGQYTLNLLQKLSEQPEILELRILVNGLVHESTKFLDQKIQSDKSRFKQHSPPNLFSANWLAKLASSSLFLDCYNTVVPHLERRSFKGYSPTDIFHSPNFFVPDFPGRSFITILDLSTLLHPHLQPASRVKFINKHIYKAISSDVKIITISERIKYELLDFFDISCDRVAVTSLGADTRYHPLNVDQFETGHWGELLGYKQYFLFVSTIEPRKNIPRLIKAYAQYRGSLSEDYPLVIAGKPGWESSAFLQELRAASPHTGIIYLGYVEQQNLPALLAGARALLYPSLYEGFGLPVLEAMQSGTPVLTSENTSMADIGGQAVMTVDPTDVEAMASAISELAADELLLEKLRDRGLEQCKTFTWEQCAKDTVRAYFS